MGGWFHANGYADYCAVLLEVKGELWEIGLGSKIIANVGASIFAILILLDIFIFIKYLLIHSKCQRVSMMIFYFLALLCLVGREIIMISLNYKPFFAMEILVTSVVCL